MSIYAGHYPVHYSGCGFRKDTMMRRFHTKMRASKRLINDLSVWYLSRIRIIPSSHVVILTSSLLTPLMVLPILFSGYLSISEDYLRDDEIADHPNSLLKDLYIHWSCSLRFSMVWVSRYVRNSEAGD